MEKALFITTESNDIDLILSFVLQDEDPMEIKSLTLIRTPKYEPFLDEFERGVDVSLEYGDEGKYMLESIEIKNDIVIIQDTAHNYKLDISSVDRKEIKRVKRIAKKMNFDSKFILEID